ncbi:phosphoglycerate kinase, partial [Candidatus Peregrinibacteria bacterium]|nr:phosphoglycerate kinase [Candidatus Peregrinibacteria bacterium]
MTDQKSLPYPVLSNADLKDKTVLLRAGFDLPMNNGEVVDTSRVEALLPTIKFILDSGASLIILAHQGRPKGERNMEYSQKPIAPVLSKLIGIDVKFCDYCRGEEAKSMAAELVAGDVLLLENLRFEKAEKSKDPEQRDELAKEIAELGDVYVNDAFTNCHRDHASMTGIPKHLPSFIGLHLEQEIRHLSEATDNPSKPVTLIISGAKMETKVPVIQHFLDCGNDILLGGLIANTFIGAKGNCLGSSRYEEEWVKKSEEILSLSMKEGSALIHVPVDSIVASDPSGADVNNVPSNS